MSEEEEPRIKGKVKSWNEKGWGFIKRDNGQKDIFFHFSNLEDPDHNPQQNDLVDFFAMQTDLGLKAVLVRRIEEK